MSNKITDAIAVTETVTIGPSHTEVALLTTPPQRVGSFARITLFVQNGQDSTMAIRRGSGVAGEVIFGAGNIPQEGTVVVVDNSPGSQYTFTASGDGGETGPSVITLSVDQIS